MDLLFEFVFGWGQNPRVVFSRERGKLELFYLPAVMGQPSFERRVPNHIAREAKAMGIEALGQLNWRTLFFGAHRLKDHVVFQRPLTAFVHHASGCTDFFVGKGSHVVLEKVDKAPFPLEDGQHLEARGVLRFRLRYLFHRLRFYDRSASTLPGGIGGLGDFIGATEEPVNRGS